MKSLEERVEKVERGLRFAHVRESVLYLFVLVVVVLGVLRLGSESDERADQTCQIFEGQHLADVRQLRDTYRYLLQLSPVEKRDGINRYVIGRLPETEKRARTDTAPEFCDDDGVGLPEPDPEVPERPRALR